MLVCCGMKDIIRSTKEKVEMSKAVFITGTGTDVGKTYITGLIVKKLAAAGKHPAYYKAAMSGNARRADGSLIPGDAMFVHQLSGIPQPLEEMCPYVYEHAWSPHLASRVEGHPVDMAVVRQGYFELAAKYDYITMEGSGGILCPLCVDERRIQLEDVLRELQLASILVADAGLGLVHEGACASAEGHHLQPLSRGRHDGRGQYRDVQADDRPAGTGGGT